MQLMKTYITMLRYNNYKKVTLNNAKAHELQKDTRAAKILKECNKILICTTNESHFLQRICQIITTEGGYRFAWVGFALHDAKKTVKPIVYEGFEEGYLETVNITWADEESGRGPTGTAIRTGKPCIVSNIQNDPKFKLWKEQARKHGYASSIALPIIFNSDIIGSLNIYASETDIFDDHEIELLVQLANDIAFGMKSLRSQTKKSNTEEELKRKEMYFRSLIENYQDIITVLNNDGTIQYESNAIEQVLGYKPEELIGKSVFEFIHPDEKQKILDLFMEGIKEAGRTEVVELLFRHKDGSWRLLEAKAKNLLDKNEVTGVAISSRDITEHKKNEEELRRRNLELVKLQADFEELFLGTIKVLSNTLDAKSRWTAGHSDSVTKYAVAIGREIGFDEKSLKELEIAAHLHDIGKIETYVDILDKKEKLTDEELELIRRHPVKGAEILSPIKQLRNIIPAVKYHHEHYDGTGYPEGLKGESIPLYARVLTVADSVDAMSSSRPYRNGLPKKEIIAELTRNAGKQFDPEIVNVFLRIYSSYSE